MEAVALEDSAEEVVREDSEAVREDSAEVAIRVASEAVREDLELVPGDSVAVPVAAEALEVVRADLEEAPVEVRKIVI